MSICKICNKKLKNANGLAKHITNQHNITKEEYYNEYIKEVSPYCKCGKRKKFRDLGVGYLKYCSMKCRSKYNEPTKYWEGKKQPQEMIDARRNTLIEKYGVCNGFLVNQHTVAENYKGIVCRGEWEKTFIDFCEHYNLKVEVPKKIDYNYEGRQRYYYPDFYLPKFDLIVEIKSTYTYLLHADMNAAKQHAAIAQGYDIVFIDEENGLKDKQLWSELYEYLCSFGESC